MNRMSRTTLTLLLTVTAFASAACQSKPEEPDPVWSANEVVASSDRVLWKITLLALETQGYPLAGGLDPSSMELMTGWQLNLAPFSKEGFRRRAEVRMHPLGEGRWKVETRVKRQMNKSLVKPLNPRYADWEWVADDEYAARILLQHIRARLAPDIELVDRPDDPVEAYLEEREAAEKE